MKDVVSGLDLWQWQQQAKQRAIAEGIPQAEVDWLLQEIAELDRLTLRLETFKDRATLPLKVSLLELDQLWQRRLEEKVPVQYLVGVVPWRNFVLTVSPAVLIPRPETECLIDLAKLAAKGNTVLNQGNWLDLGTGSGAIAIGLADEFPDASIHAVDFSLEALTLAQENAKNCGVGDRIQFYQGSWFEPIQHLKGKVAGLVSNPPYIPKTIIAELQPEVRLHEPHLALDGGDDGLDCIRHLVSLAPGYLISGGIWLIEMMAGQAAAVTELLNQQGCYYNIQIHKDLAGIDRFALAYRV